MEQFFKEMEESHKKVGTREYDGVAYFWSSEYKHTMRNISEERRILIHNLLLDHNLPLNGVSELHNQIIYNTEEFVRDTKLNLLISK